LTDKEKTKEFLEKQADDAREMIKEMRHCPCELCDGYGFIADSLATKCIPRVKCPRCNGG